MVGLVLTVMITGMSSCEKYSFPLPSVSTVDTLYFQADIQPIFTNNCITCHGAVTKPDLRDGKAYKSLTDGGYVVPFDANTSRLYLHMISAGHAPRSTDVDKQKVLIWINQGALDN